MYQPCTPYRWIETINVNYKHLILTRVSHILIKIVKLIKQKSNSIENTIIFVRCNKFHFVRCEFQVLFSKSAWESRHWGWNKTSIRFSTLHPVIPIDNAARCKCTWPWQEHLPTHRTCIEKSRNKIWLTVGYIIYTANKCGMPVILQKSASFIFADVIYLNIVPHSYPPFISRFLCYKITVSYRVWRGNESCAREGRRGHNLWQS